MKTFKRILSASSVLLVIAALPILLWQRQNIYDWWRLYNYDPPSHIEEIAENSKFNEYGKKLFFVHKPELNDRNSFNQNCPSQEQTIVLGCYISHQSIYIFDVTDERLKGIKEVTAAHEMLHAAYDRLSTKERQRIDSLTNEAYTNLNDQQLSKTIELYKSKDASVVPNELHSILGTEVRELPEELSTYYQRYFTDRMSVVELSENYEQVFVSQQNEIRTLADQITSLESELASRKTTIENLETELNAKHNNLNYLKNSGDIEKYNAGVPEYNSLVYRIRALVNSYNSDVIRLNELIEKHNQLAVEQKRLNNQIDSHATEQ